MSIYDYECRIYGKCSTTDNTIFIVYGVLYVVAGFFLLLNLITYYICRSKSKYYTPRWPFLISLLVNLLWPLPFMCFAALGLGVQLNGEKGSAMPAGIPLIIIPLGIIIASSIVFNLCSSKVHFVRDKIFPKHGGCNGIFEISPTHIEPNTDINSQLRDKEPVIKFYGQNPSRFGVAKATYYFNYASWENELVEEVPEGTLRLITPVFEPHFDEESQVKLEDMKREMKNKLQCPQELSASNINFYWSPQFSEKYEVITYKHGFQHGVIDAKSSRSYRFNNSGFGKFIRLISNFFGMTYFWDNLYFCCMKEYNPRVVVKISMKNEYKNEPHFLNTNNLKNYEDLPWFYAKNYYRGKRFYVCPEQEEYIRTHIHEANYYRQQSSYRYGDYNESVHQPSSPSAYQPGYPQQEQNIPPYQPPPQGGEPAYQPPPFPPYQPPLTETINHDITHFTDCNP